MSDNPSTFSKFANWFARSKGAYMVLVTFGLAGPLTIAFWMKLAEDGKLTLSNAVKVVLVSVAMSYLGALITWWLYFRRLHLEILERDRRQG